MTLRIEVAPQLLLQLGNHKTKHDAFDSVGKVNNGTKRSHNH